MNRLAGLEEIVREALPVPSGVEIQEAKVKSGVYRLGCMVDGAQQSYIAKRLDPDVARRNELVVRRWLPAVGLEDAAPALVSIAAEPDGSSVWHLYGDLGNAGLDPTTADFGRIERAVASIARIHVSFAGHPLIPECRLWGGDLGIYFYTASVHDAIASLEPLCARGWRLGTERMSLCQRLLGHVTKLADEQTPRAEALGRHGGPETLLHGDLWPMNVMVYPNGRDLHVRLIDWDHAAVGPVAYDLSTFLNRFPKRDRMAILHMYEAEVCHAGWHLPPPTELNMLFETFELARIANRVIWPALAAGEEGAGWAYAELEEVERWFERLAPVLPLGEECARS